MLRAEGAKKIDPFDHFMCSENTFYKKYFFLPAQIRRYPGYPGGSLPNKEISRISRSRRHPGKILSKRLFIPFLYQGVYTTGKIFFMIQRQYFNNAL